MAVKAVVVVVVVQCRRRRECQARRLKEDWHSLDINFHIPAASLSPSSLAAPLVSAAAQRQLATASLTGVGKLATAVRREKRAETAFTDSAAVAS